MNLYRTAKFLESFSGHSEVKKFEGDEKLPFFFFSSEIKAAGIRNSTSVRTANEHSGEMALRDRKSAGITPILRQATQTKLKRQASSKVASLHNIYVCGEATFVGAGKAGKSNRKQTIEVKGTRREDRGEGFALKGNSLKNKSNKRIGTGK